MARALRVSHPATSSARLEPVPATAVGASYPFDPRADGLAGIYAARVLERGGDPRALCAEVRADRLGLSERGAINRALMQRKRVTSFGRGTARHLTAMSVPQRPPAAAPVARRATRSRRPIRQPAVRWSRRLVAAGLAALLILPLGVIAANAQDASPQARYIVQPGDTLDSVAAEFGVDPSAILAASAVQDPPYLSPEEILVIPEPNASPDEAASTAMYFQGASPFVVGAHDVAPGETLADISSAYSLDPLALASFNGLSDVDSLNVGQRLRIPLTDTVTNPSSEWNAETVSSDQAHWPSKSWDSAVAPEASGGTDARWEEQPASGPVIAAEVPAYMQMYNLSCEYAATYIATAAFGPGVPESAFMERIGVSSNPHWGYRGDITGPWGGTDDYGIYAEALVPTLNEYGYVADVFYGGDPASLTARLDAGMPVVTWLGYFGDTAWQQNDEQGSYLLAPGMHVVTVYGYDDYGVYLSNPGRGTHDYYAWDDFLAKWAVLDGMALAVAPM